MQYSLPLVILLLLMECSSCERQTPVDAAENKREAAWLHGKHGENLLSFKGLTRELTKKKGGRLTLACSVESICLTHG